MMNLTSKLGETNNIEHIKGSKIHPQNQVILDCIMPSIPLKHKCLSIILIWVMVSHFLFGKNRHGIGKKGGYFFIGNGAEIRPLKKGRKSPSEFGTQYPTSGKNPATSCSSKNALV